MFFTSETFMSLVWPTVAAVVIGLSSYVSAVPLPYLLTAMVIGFAAAATGLLRMSDWRQRNMIEGKLAFSQVLTNIITGSDNKEPLFIKEIGLGAQWSNLAGFPIEFKVDEFYTEIENRVPQNRPTLGKSVEISEQGAGFHRAHPISVSKGIKGSAVRGRIRYKISYWRKNRTRIATIEREHVVTIADGGDDQSFSVSYVDA